MRRGEGWGEGCVGGVWVRGEGVGGVSSRGVYCCSALLTSPAWPRWN